MAYNSHARHHHTALAHAQGREKILNTDSGRVVLHHIVAGLPGTKDRTDKYEQGYC